MYYFKNVSFKKRYLVKYLFNYLIIGLVFFLFYLYLLKFQVFSNVEANLSYDNNSYKAYILNNISYVDTQVLSAILDTPVYWDPNEKVLIASNLRIYTRAVVYKNRLLIALRDVLIPLGYEIKWNQVNRSITIYKPSYKKSTSKADLKIENSNTNSNDKINKKYEIPFIDNDNKNDTNKSKEINKQPTATPPTVFIPRSASNEEFKVTVSDLKESKLVKGLYTPKEGFKFIILTASQQNLSNKVQLYTGKFVLYDDKGYKYEYIEGLSSYILQVLLPSGMNFGTLVFEIPENNIPSKLVLETYGSTPITLSLI
jgi:hypothetical protein